MRLLFIHLLMLLSALLFTGCATMFSGTKSEVHFTSVPSGATVIAGKQSGTTPVTLQIAKSTKTVKFIPPPQPAVLKTSVEDHEPLSMSEREIKIDRNLDMNWFFLDLFCTPGFGLVGGIVDGFTAAWYDLPGRVHCDFTRPPRDPASEAWFLHDPGSN